MLIWEMLAIDPKQFENIMFVLEVLVSANHCLGFSVQGFTYITIFVIYNMRSHSPWNLWSLNRLKKVTSRIARYFQGIVGCTPTNVPLWEIPI